ncbi:MAG: membrane protein insertase YidC [Candidatus Omnitrophica bacterium]|nr:membrane protein insertase YidC [Candidatus Omnitrophota bacterium]
MDRRAILAFIISFLILIFYKDYLKVISPPKSDDPITTSQSVTSEQLNKKKSHELKVDNVSGKVAVLQEENYVTLENSKLRIVISNRGANIVSVSLKEYKETNKDTEVTIFDSSVSGMKEKNCMGAIRVFDESGRADNSYNMLTFNEIDSGGYQTKVFRSPIHDGIQIEKIITLTDDNYSIEFSAAIENKSQNEKQLKVELSTAISYEVENRYDKNYINSVIKNYNNYISTSINKLVKEGYSFNEKIEWLALEKKYFINIFNPTFEVEHVRVNVINGDTIMGYISSKSINVLPQSSAKINALYYIGPKKYYVLKSYGKKFEDAIARGFFGGLKTYLLIVLLYFNKIFNNYGFSIIALTVIIKILFMPLTHKSFESMRRMQELQPQMKALQEKHKESPQKLNKEMMELYKKHKANPFGGCFPLLLQMPVFIALYHTLSQAVELRGAPFIWWIKDLSGPDKIFMFPFTVPIIGNSLNVLPLLMMFSMVWQQKMTPTTAASKEQQRMMVMMPIIFGVMFYNMPSGLVLYWFMNNILTIGQQIITKRLRK